MKAYQRACLVIANAGIVGFLRHAARKLRGPGHIPSSPLRDQLEEMARTFTQRASELGYKDLTNYLWYHTIDLGNGLVTPGMYDYRSTLSAFSFPEDMAGMNVLDVGSATGFFAFEFERRGANVTSVELPSIAALDRFYGESLEQTLAKVARLAPHTTFHAPGHVKRVVESSNLDELYEFFYDGPFKFCHRVLKSKVKRCYSAIYDLSKETLGRDDYDLVFLGDILWHTIDPFRALAAVVPLCKSTLVIAQGLPDLDGVPAMVYLGGDKPGEDFIHWWAPNRLCFEQILRKLGFGQIKVIGEHTGFTRPEGQFFTRAIIRARK